MPVPVDLSKPSVFQGMQDYADRMLTLAQTAQYKEAAEEQRMINEENAAVQEIIRNSPELFEDVITGEKTGELNLADPANMNSPLDPQFELANRISKVAPFKALEYRDKLYAQQKAIADAGSAAEDYNEKKYQRVMRGVDAWARLFGPDVVRSKEEQDAAVKLADKLNQEGGGPGSVIPEYALEAVRDQEYDENKLVFMAERARDLKERTELEFKRDEEERVRRQNLLAQANADRDYALQLRAQKETERYHRAQENAGGDKKASVVTSTDDQRSQTKTALMTMPQYAELARSVDPADVAEFDDIVNNVTDNALAMYQNKQATTYDEAIHKAIALGEQSGQLRSQEVRSNTKAATAVEAVTGTAAKSLLGKVTTPEQAEKYGGAVGKWAGDVVGSSKQKRVLDRSRPNGRTPETAIPVPVGENGKPDRSKMIDGIFYKLINGNAGLWDGEKLIEVPVKKK